MNEPVRKSSPANGHFQRGNAYGKDIKALEKGWSIHIYPVDEDNVVLGNFSFYLPNYKVKDPK
jgi:hypothetical protein